ncbi:MAG TPA: NAD(P)H-binding protein [Micromonosporaceae bacterium]|nr:NAD(P)H-binding protein [Micromonosporaceae bacterium]
MMSRIFIAGAAGTAGRSYVQAFSHAGHAVRAGVRPASEAQFGDDVEVWPVDFEDAGATRAAMDDIDAVVIALAGRGPNAADQEAVITRNVARAAVNAGVGHLMYTSVHLADQTTGVPHFDVKGVLEVELAALAPRLTVLRPTTFADSLTAPWLRNGIQEHGILVSPFGCETAISYVATDDLARIAVAALATPQLQREPVVVAGLSSTTYAELLPLLGQLAGRPVTYQQIPLDEVRHNFGSDLAAMMELFNRDGFTAEPSPVLRDLRLVPRPVQDYLRQSWVRDGSVVR